MTKTGKPFGVVQIEDYSGTTELALFSDDYLKFKQYLTQGYFLFIKAKILPRFKDENNLEVKVSMMKMLPDVGNDFAKSITLNIDSQNINPENIKKLSGILGEHPGKLPVRFSVKDDQYKVEMASKKLKVNFSKNLIESLSSIDDCKFKINT
jgi:DNA polymerase-3 subunit alpha